jgi:hypothetical protein
MTLYHKNCNNERYHPFDSGQGIFLLYQADETSQVYANKRDLKHTKYRIYNTINSAEFKGAAEEVNAINKPIYNYFFPKTILSNPACASG